MDCLAEGAVKEARERVFSALKSCGFKIPPARITVNLAPADVRKAGSAYALAMAAREGGGCGIIVPEANAREGAVVKGIPVMGARDPGQVVRMLSGEEVIEAA